MRVVSIAAGVLAAVVVAAGGSAPPASATNYGIELEGRYLFTANGDWAQNNDVFHDEKTVRELWTVTSVCQNPRSCTAHIVSSAGWETDGVYTEDRWVVRRAIADWMPCADGTFAPGNQEFRFWPVDANGQRYRTDGSTFGGIDETKGPSGACGKNLSLVIRIPMRLQRAID